MPAISYQSDLFQNCKEIYQFLVHCQQQSIRDKRTKVASLSLAIESIDPLVAFHHLSKRNQQCFYFENPHRDEVVVAIDTVAFQTAESSNRFQQTQTFVQACLTDIVSTGPQNIPFSGPHFFCSFTFFDRKSDQESDQTSAQNSPFPAATVFLPQWQIARHGDQCSVVINLAINHRVDIDCLSELIWHQLQKIKSLCYQVLNWNRRRLHPYRQQNLIDTSHFTAAVSSALDTIRTHHLRKVVLAHAVDVVASVPFHITHSLDNLRQRHPDCYIFLTQNRDGQSFLGASPERLISIRNRELITDALAGSAPRGETAAMDTELGHQLQLSLKEQNEHRVVVDFITQQLQGLGLQTMSPAMPKLLQLSNIQHLHTPIRARLPMGIHPLEIVTALHPTPAVAGAPTRLACEQIQQFEQFERSLYAAPLGWVDHRGNSEFIVGIRSALVEGVRARLYAGAGIVAGSDPERELTEVELKLQALLKALC